VSIRRIDSIYLNADSGFAVNAAEGSPRQSRRHTNKTGINNDRRRRRHMSKTSLSDFANKVRAKSRISFGDVQRLQRDILPDGILSRDDAALLIELDRGVARADAFWQNWLVAAVVDFVVWTERPTGIVDETAAAWLAAALTADGHARPTKTGRLIAREVVQEAQAFENEALALLGAGLAKTPCRAASPEPEPVRLAA
jgi:hypothetical protein